MPNARHPQTSIFRIAEVRFSSLVAQQLSGTDKQTRVTKLHEQPKLSDSAKQTQILSGFPLGRLDDFLATHVGTHGLRDDDCLLYTSPSPRDVEESRMPSSA